MTDPLIVPKKTLGQHWLQDQLTLKTIIDTAEISRNDVVLEIGPGLGSLTTLLVKEAKQVIAVELDKKLADNLSHKIPAGNLKVITDDILHFNLNSLPIGYKVVANIPYYLTNNLIRVLCESKNPFVIAVLLVQKEVAERVTAKPGNMSLLSISVQFYCEVELGNVVPAKLFTPPPKVDSQILKLGYRQQPLFPEVNQQAFFRLVKVGFSQRRKTILNSLSAGLQISRSEVKLLLESCNIDPIARAQTLPLEDWHKLFRTIKKLKM